MTPQRLDSGTHGKEKAEDQAPPRNARTVETVTILSVNHCQQCGGDLQNVSLPATTLINIVFEKWLIMLTMTNKGYNPLLAISMALAGEWDLGEE